MGGLMGSAALMQKELTNRTPKPEAS